MPRTTAVRPQTTPPRGEAAAIRRPSGWTAKPVPRVTPAIRALNATVQPAVVAVTSPGSTAIDTVAEPNTHGATGATDRRNTGWAAARPRSPERRDPAGGGGAVPASGARHSGTITARTTS